VSECDREREMKRQREREMKREREGDEICAKER
jgi:hypothetical protein